MSNNKYVTPIKPEVRDTLRRVHEGRWDMDEGDLSVYRHTDDDGIVELSSTEHKEETCRDLVSVWADAWPALQSAEAVIIKLKRHINAIHAQQRAARRVRRVEKLSGSAAWRGIGKAAKLKDAKQRLRGANKVVKETGSILTLNATE